MKVPGYDHQVLDSKAPFNFRNIAIPFADSGHLSAAPSLNDLLLGSSPLSPTPTWCSEVFNNSSSEDCAPRVIYVNGIKMRSCLFCDYSSIKVDHVKKHMLVHTREKPFACQFCSYKASQKVNLRAHTLRMHPEIL